MGYRGFRECVIATIYTMVSTFRAWGFNGSGTQGLGVPGYGYGMLAT